MSRHYIAFFDLSLQNVLGAADHTYGHVPHVLEGHRLSFGNGSPSLELGFHHVALHGQAVVFRNGHQPIQIKHEREELNEERREKRKLRRTPQEFYFYLPLTQHVA